MQTQTNIGIVAEIEPLLLDEGSTAKYLGRSRSWLRNQRSIDNIREKEEGLPRVGPPFIVMGRTVFYRKAELDTWVETVGEVVA